jgi:AAA+ superfamily predicted ATPase
MIVYKVTAYFKDPLYDEHGEIIDFDKVSYEEKEQNAIRMNDLYGSTIIDRTDKTVYLVCTDKMEEKKLVLWAIYDYGNRVIAKDDIIVNHIKENLDIFISSFFKQIPEGYEFKTKGTNVVRTMQHRSYLANTTELCDKIESITPRSGEGTNCRVMDSINLDRIPTIALLKDFCSEIDRIKANKFKTFHGHPVHYIIRYEDQNYILPALLNTMYDNHRLINICFSQNSAYNIGPTAIENIYRNNIGNTVVITISKIENSGDDSAKRERGTINESLLNKIIELSKEFSPSVLTILSIKDVSDKEKIMDIASDNKVKYVSLLPRNVSAEDAMRYLTTSAKQDGFKRYTGEVINGKIYTPNEIDRIYSNWKNKYLINAMGYDKISKNDIKKELSYDPAERLNNMIGLKNVKEIVNQIVSYFKMQKYYKEKGITASTPCRHMVFYGNPGTAKTTVARLLANILKNADIITNGKLIEVSRAELVGMYVGHTAPMVKRRIKQAKGGILFIDEAYSLVDKSGSFGDEAINTLVQEMDNVREDTIIILAGYPDKMEQFLNTNPGLRSRIGFHVKFDRYSKEELMQILLNMAKKEKFTLTKDAIKKAEKEIDAAYSTKDFGNGRFIRSLLEQAMMKHATRITKNNQYLDMDDDELVTIKSEDISNMNKSVERNKVGF